jgi:hypothetical protein
MDADRPAPGRLRWLPPALAQKRAYRPSASRPTVFSHAHCVRLEVLGRAICVGYRARVQMIELDHVQVAAPLGSENAARLFYGELVGLPELEKPEALRSRGGVWFACGAHQLHVG